MATIVSYHRDGYGPAHPAINVKVYQSGYAFRSAAVDAGMPEQSDAIHELACERVASDFWQAAQEIATQRGLGEITQEGRSGGWLVFEIDPDYLSIDSEPCGRTEWLRQYRAMAEWCAAYIANAPARVRSIAQDIAMDELGARAVFLGRLRWPGYEVSTQTYELSTRKAV